MYETHRETSKRVPRELFVEHCRDFPANLPQTLPNLHTFIYLLIYIQIVFVQNCMMAASSKKWPLALACVRLRKEIINIALEAGCEAITALGSHQHTCSNVLRCYTFPEVEMSSFTVITCLPPLNIDYHHFSILSPAVEMALMARYPCTRSADFPLRRGGGGWNHGGEGAAGDGTARRLKNEVAGGPPAH